MFTRCSVPTSLSYKLTEVYMTSIALESRSDWKEQPKKPYKSLQDMMKSAALTRRLLLVSAIIHLSINDVYAAREEELATSFQWNNTYQKPIPSNGPCITNIEQMQRSLLDAHNTLKLDIAKDGENMTFHKNQFQCLGCHHVQEKCPIDTNTGLNCQERINALYDSCDGVTLPMHYYYDAPDNTISGSFNDEHTQREIKMAAARCGCNSSLILSKREAIIMSLGLCMWLLILS